MNTNIATMALIQVLYDGEHAVLVSAPWGKPDVDGRPDVDGKLDVDGKPDVDCKPDVDTKPDVSPVGVPLSVGVPVLGGTDAVPVAVLVGVPLGVPEGIPLGVAAVLNGWRCVLPGVVEILLSPTDGVRVGVEGCAAAGVEALGGAAEPDGGVVGADIGVGCPPALVDPMIVVTGAPGVICRFGRVVPNKLSVTTPLGVGRVVCGAKTNRPC